MRIAIIGGSDYEEGPYEDFLYALSSKYPDAIIVTGTAVGKNEYEEDADGKRRVARKIPSAERKAESLMTGLGHTVIIPDMTTPTAQYFTGTKMPMSDLQLGWILSGQWELYRTAKGSLNHRFIEPRPDAIVAVGNLESSRARAALDHWKKFDAWRLPEFKRPFHNVAAPPKKQKAKTYKATKKNERDLIAA